MAIDSCRRAIECVHDFTGHILNVDVLGEGIHVRKEFSEEQTQLSVLLTTLAFTALGLTISGGIATAVPVMGKAISILLDVSLYGIFLGFYKSVIDSIPQRYTSNESSNNEVFKVALSDLRTKAKNEPIGVLITSVALTALGMCASSVIASVIPIPFIQPFIDNTLKEALLAVSYTIIDSA